MPSLSRKRAATVLAAAIALSMAVPALYLALGGASYRPAPVADPCQERELSTPAGLDERLQQVLLSSLDGAACSLGSSREELLLALSGQEDLRAFADTRHISTGKVADAFAAAVGRAVDDAERTGALDGTLGRVLRLAAEYVSLERLLDLAERAADFFD